MVTASLREQANLAALRRMCEAEPVLVGVAAARDAVPGMTDRTILTSGPAMPFASYTGGQRAALVYAAMYEGLADSPADAGRRMILQDSFSLLASGGLLLLIVLAEPWLLALAVQVGVLLGGFYLFMPTGA